MKVNYSSPLEKPSGNLPTFAPRALLLVGCLLASAVQAQVAPAVPQASTTSAKEEAVKMSPFEVTGKSQLGYRSTQTLAGAGIATDLRDLPSSISVMNRELMDDLMITHIDQLSTFYISGENEPLPEASIPSGTVRMRGITTTNLRDGIYIAYNPDSHSMDRVEILRGPNGFLYTGAGAGGNPNQVTKRAQLKDGESVRFMVGSYSLYRTELDVNRVLIDNEKQKLAVRTSIGYQKSDGWAHYAARDFKGALLTVNYRPFRGKTNFNASIDYGNEDLIMAPKILSDQFATSERTGATTPYALTTGGITYVPALGLTYDSVGLRRTSGTNLALVDRNFIAPETNFRGPGAYNNSGYAAMNFTLDQRISDNLNLQFMHIRSKNRKSTRTTVGSSQASIYKDVNPTLPGGAPNPYFNKYYNEYVNREYYFTEPTAYYKAAAVYDLKLSFMTQNIIGAAHRHSYEPAFVSFSEFVDPRSSRFKGAYIDANTIEAYRANLITQNNNRFYRRFYLVDGDGPNITNPATVAGQSVYTRDITADGNNGRLWWRGYWNNGFSVGSTGTYLNGRLNSFVGWRRDSFNRTTGSLFYNVARDDANIQRSTTQLTPLDYTLPAFPRQNPGTRVKGDSVNYGLVYRVTNFLSLYANYGESVSLNVAAGGDGFIPGTTIGSPKGYGQDYGIRWLFLDGAIESNWTYYKNNKQNVAAISAAVSDELRVLVAGVNPAGTDTQTVTPKGIEFDTILNINRGLRLLWNLSSNKLSNTDRYPALKTVVAEAKGKAPTPVSDAFLASVPEGTPSAGFTKLRSNLVASYRFDRGILKGFSVGGGAQYRDVTYQGNFDLNLDGIAEEIWTPSYVVTNLMFGYRTKAWDRPVDFGLNVNNVLNKQYFRATALNTGGWGEERNFRFSARISL
jgi:outer membrane receptor for ferric coprogen and ferric-rhodotorulic acid